MLPQIETSLDDLVKVWYPRTIDSIHGGFLTDFDSKWIQKGPQHKMLVSQARHIWSTATLAAHYKDTYYENLSAHGYRFLKNHMWDSVHGGFHTLLGLENGQYKPISKGKVPTETHLPSTVWPPITKFQRIPQHLTGRKRLFIGLRNMPMMLFIKDISMLCAKTVPGCWR